MSEDAAQGTEPAPGAAAQPPAADNPVFRTREAVQARVAAQKDAQAPDKDAERMLAEAAGAGEGAEHEPGSIEALEAELARVQEENKHARTWQKRAKENAEKAKLHDAYVESQKTEHERLTDQLAAAQAEATQAREDRFRLLAAAQHDLPPSLIGHLGGGTEDEITERAEAFAQAINERAEVIAAAQAQAAAQQQPRNGNGGGFRPVESLRPGALPASDNKPNDANAWMRQALGRRK